jgi:hypothetical protein
MIRIKQMNKRADISSILISMVIMIFIFILVAVLFARIFGDVLDEMQGMDEFSDDAKANFKYVDEKSIPLLDYAILFIFFAFLIGIIISAVYTDVHPVLLVVFIIVLIISLVFSGIFSNVYSEISGDSEISPTASQFSMSSWLMNHLPVTIFFIALVVGIILYSKRGNNVNYVQ